jgi:hypothetical protein
MSKAPASTALSTTTIRTSAISAPPRFVEWLAEQIPRSRLFALKQTSTVGPPQDVDSWATFKNADALAELIWQRAIEDAQTVAGLGATVYTVFATSKEGGEGARWGLRLPPPKSDGTGNGAPVEPPTEAGAIANVLRHLNMRESASHSLFVESLEGLFAAVRIQLDEASKARTGDRTSFESVIAGYKHLVNSMSEGYALAHKELSAQLKRTQEAYDAIVSKHLDLIPQLEELASNRHERDLATIKAQHTERRKDKAFDQVQSVLFPVIAKKMGIPLGVLLPGTGSPPGAPAPNSAPKAASAPPVADGVTTQATFLGADVLRAIEAFLGAFDPADLEPVRAAMGEDNRARFDAVIVALAQQQMKMEEGAKPAAAQTSATNGAGKETTS